MYIEQIIEEIQDSVLAILQTEDCEDYYKSFVSNFEAMDKSNIVGMLVNFLDSACIITDIRFPCVESIRQIYVVCTFDIFIVQNGNNGLIVCVQQIINSYPRLNSII